MILAGIITGLGAALGGGLANISITLASRRVGLLLTYVGAQLAAFATIALVAIVLAEPIPLDSALPASALAVAAIATATYLFFFGALMLGPVSVVSPVVGAYGGIAVILALIVFGEAISLAQAVAIAAAISGVILAAATVDLGSMRVQLRGPGPGLAVLAAVGFAANVTMLAVVIRDFGWLPALVMWRVWMSIIAISVLGLALLWRRTRHGLPPAATFGALDRRLVGLLVVAGMLDTLSTVFLAVGLEVSFASLVGLLSSLGPMSGAVWGLLLFRERLTRIQAVGIALVGLSLVVLALA